CSEEQPARLQLADEAILPGAPAHLPTVLPGTAVPIATGAMIPRGANAVVMVEDTDLESPRNEAILLVRRPVAPGANVTFAGTDIGQSETVLRRGEVLTSRETGVLAAIGVARVPVVRRPRVAIISTGNELLPPGQPDRKSTRLNSSHVSISYAVF